MERFSRSVAGFSLGLAAVALVCAWWAGTAAAVPTGYIEVCEQTGTPHDSFSLTVTNTSTSSTRSITVPAHQCSAPISIDAGTVTVAQAGVPFPWIVTNIYAIPLSELISTNTATGIATVTVGPSQDATAETQVTFASQNVFLWWPHVRAVAKNILVHIPGLDPMLRTQLTHELDAVGDPGNPRDKLASVSNLRAFVAGVEADSANGSIPADVATGLVAPASQMLAAFEGRPAGSPQDQLEALKHAVDKAPELQAADAVTKALRHDLDLGDPADPQNQARACSQLAMFVSDVQTQADTGAISPADSADWAAAATALSTQIGCGGAGTSG